MKRIGHLFEQIVDFENLFQAFRSASKNRRFRNDVLRFAWNLEENLINIQNHLIYKTYEIGRYKEFYIYDPKKRLIMSLPFRDRVVQWAIYRVLEPLVDKQFIYDSYACRKGKGMQAAANRVQYWMRHLSRRFPRPYYLKLDISKYFYRIDHDVLLGILNRNFKDPDLMWLLEKIIRSEDTLFGIPLGDHGFEQERVQGVGMPIGNLTSQLFANLYLNELDQFAKHTLKLRYYARYMDDIVAFHHDKKELHKARQEMEWFLNERLRLTLNNKTAVRPISVGMDFVGYRIWPTHRKIRKKTALKMKSRLRYLERAYSRGEVDVKDVNATVQSYLGLCKHANSYSLRRAIFSRFRLTRNADPKQKEEVFFDESNGS
ncbi:reverse transcriptase domain-containing protein [Paenibacillus naphthalenovorans]|uniref:reverse transcriptase domain-containing protein n=1 Tax=Paenibacillus naphthalenovorans TaxID=162209 RepID=UPI003D292A3D